MDLNTLKTNAGIIRDATLPEENTAFRLGSWLVSLIEFLTDTSIEAVMTGIVPAVTADGIALALSFQKADGSTFTKFITLPLADAEKAGLMSPAMVAKIAAMQSSINAINTKNAEQDDNITALQSDVSSVAKKNTTQDSQIQGLSTLVEQNSVNIENVTGTANTNKNNITALQGDVSDNASAIDALQKNAVSKHQELTDKIDANNEFIAQVESTCNTRQDEADAKNAEQDAKMKSLDNIDENILIRLDEMQLSIDSLSQRVKALEN